MKLPSQLKPEDLIAIVDTREQNPLDLAPLQAEVRGLTTGDYSLLGLEHVVRIERKSLTDLLSCIGQDRERFQREVDRLLAYPIRVLVIESSWPEIEIGDWRSRIKPSQAIGSLLGWQASGLSVHMCHDHERAGRHVARFLCTVARRRYRELRALLP